MQIGDYLPQVAQTYDRLANLSPYSRWPCERNQIPVQVRWTPKFGQVAKRESRS